MTISAEDIRQLRYQTGAGMMDVKKALEEAGGDQEKAVEILRKKGQARAAKRAQRIADAGLIDSYVHLNRVGVLVEVNCETDFVARTGDFKQFVRDVAMQIVASNPRYLQPEDIPPGVIDKEKAVYAEEVKGKTESASKQIINGKLEKYYEQVCLLKQPFIKDPDKTIETYQTELVSRLGENIKIARFARMELGTYE